jgi:AcrR family transcriptional regulator
MTNQRSISYERRHERGKAERRALILKTAVQVLSDKGEVGLTMREIATKAGLSPVTVYNLIGSKYSILSAIVDQEMRGLVEFFDENASHDTIERIFDIVDIGAVYYQKREEFYKTLFGTLLRNSSTQMALEVWSERSANMRGLLSAAVEHGKLERTIPVEIIAAMFTRLGKAVAQEWIDGSLSADQARIELGRSFHTVLARFTTESSRAAMAKLGERYGL